MWQLKSEDETPDGYYRATYEYWKEDNNQMTPDNAHTEITSYLMNHGLMTHMIQNGCSIVNTSPNAPLTMAIYHYKNTATLDFRYYLRGDQEDQEKDSLMLQFFAHKDTKKNCEELISILNQIVFLPPS